MQHLLARERGQAITEYVLMLLLAVSLVGAMGLGFRRAVARLWQELACEITSPCPDCPSDNSVRDQISQGACRR